MTDWMEVEHRYYMNTTRRMPLVLVRGRGARAWDDKGNEYLDFVGGWATNVLGHCHPVLVAAIAEQASTLVLASNQFYTVPQLKLAELLVESSCCDRVFLCNSGAEANEGAVKLARRYGRLHRDGAYQVITALGSFHGRTLAMTAATGQPRHQELYRPLPEGFVNVEYDDVAAIERAIGPQTCAVMLEAIQGEGGVRVPKDGYLRQVHDLCRERGILLILDEVQTAMGRLGTLFAYEQAGIEPDVVTLAKGLGGGVPIGAIMAREHAAVFSPGEHGTTFGGNPLACAAGYAVLRYILDNDVAGNCRRVGGYLKGRLEGLAERFAPIAEVRGRGLLLAVEFTSDIAERVTRDCLGAGLLVNTVRPNAVRLMPPLIIGEGEVDVAVAILERVLEGVAAGTGANA